MARIEHKILVLGVTGMAGHLIALYLQEKGYIVTGFARKKIDCVDTIVGDIRDFVKLKKIINEGAYSVVINAIGILNKAVDDNILDGILINSYLPHYLADITAHSATRIIHLSTDCVFSGAKGQYIESDIPDGESLYDITKHLGEIDDGKNLTFRNSIVGPDIKLDGTGLFNWFMQQNGTIEGYQNTYWSGVSTITLARAIDKAIQENLVGIYHLTNNRKISKYSLLCLFNKICRGNTIEILPEYDHFLDKSIVNTRKDFDFVVPNYLEMVIEIKMWIEHHGGVYPHYKKRGGCDE